MKYLKEYLIIICLGLVFSFIAIFNWFKDNTIIYYWDSLLSFDLQHSLKFFNTWSSNIFPGDSGFGWAWVPYVLPLSILENIFSSLSIAQFSLYVFFITLSIVSFNVFLTFLLGYLRISKNKILKLGIFIFSVFYSLNLYTFYYSYFMFNPQIYIYSMLPLNLLFLIKLFPLDHLKNKNNSVWLFLYFLSLLFMIPGFISYIFLAQYLVIVSIYLLFYFISSGIKLLSRKTINLFIFLILILLINSWWFFPIIPKLTNQYASQAGLGTSIYLDINAQGSTLLNILRLLGSPMMINNAFSWNYFYANNSLWTLSIFILPLLLIYLTFKLKDLKRKNILIYFLTIFIVLLFIIKAGNPPLAWILRFAFDYVPFFGAFRDAYQKAGLFYFFSYFTLTGVGLILFLDFLIKNKKTKFIALTMFLIIIAGIFITGPFFIFSYDNIKKINFTYAGKDYIFSSKTKLPTEYYELKTSLEKKCQNTTVLVIPKASIISNAVWEKYGTSYVGQEILNRLISCNFLNTQFIQNIPDSFNMSPYLMLQEGDWQGFKNFLAQNQIGLILIKKDNVPFYYTNYLNLNNVNVENTSTLLKNDFDFVSLFENEYFQVFKFKPLERDLNYGFSTPVDISYTNSQLNSGEDFQIFSNQLGLVNGYIALNNVNQLKEFNTMVNHYLSVANCVGCIKIQNKIPQTDNETFLTKIKGIIKLLLGKNKLSLSPEDNISYSLISTQKEFINMTDKLNNGTKDEIKKQVSKYASSFQTTLDNLNQSSLDFFAKNNKYIEVLNFLTPQQQKLVNYIDGEESYKLDSPLRDSELRGQLLYLTSYASKSIKTIKQKVWETDYLKNIYRMRLDVPYSGNYSCEIKSRKKQLKVEKISINNKELFDSSMNSIFLEKGSYPLEIKYKMDSVINTELISNSPDNVNEIKIGLMDNGEYSLNLTFAKESYGKFVVFLTRERLNTDRLDSLNVNKDSIVFNEIIDKNSEDKKNFAKKFNISNFDKPDYYFYIISLSSEFDRDRDTYINFVISPLAGNEDLRFYCVSDTENKNQSSSILDIKKENSMKYVIKLSKDYYGFLSFNQTYNRDWVAYTVKDTKKQYFNHFPNSYSNAWYIKDPINTEVIVEFDGHRKSVKTALILIIAFCLFLTVYIKLDKKE